MAKKVVEIKPEMSVNAAGRKGGEATRDNHGPDYYVELGRRGGQRMKKLLEKGLEAEAQDEVDAGSSR